MGGSWLADGEAFGGRVVAVVGLAFGILPTSDVVGFGGTADFDGFAVVAGVVAVVLGPGRVVGARAAGGKGDGADTVLGITVVGNTL